MGRSIIFAAAVMACTVQPAYGATPEYAAEVRLDAPIGWWRLSDPVGASRAIDSSGQGLHGRYSGERVTRAWRTGSGDTGAFFEDGRVVVTHDARLDLLALTVEAVVVVTSTPARQVRIAEKSTESGGVEALYGLSITPEARLLFEYSLAGTPRSLLSRQVVQIGRVQHVVATFDGTVASVYVNGALDHDVARPGILTRGTTRALAIGNQELRDRPFLGVIDEVAIYDYALSPTRIGEHYAALLVAGSLPLVDPVACGCRAASGSDSWLPLAFIGIVLMCRLSKRRLNG